MSVCAFVPYANPGAVPEDAPETCAAIERQLDPAWDVATATDITYRGMHGIALWSPLDTQAAELCAELVPLLPRGRFTRPLPLH